MSWLKRILPPPDYEYDEGHPEFWREKSFSIAFTRDTPVGFRAQYELKGTIKRDDDGEFRKWQMLSDSSQTALLLHFNCSLFRPLLNCSCIFALDWLSYIEPRVLVYHRTSENSDRFALDRNGTQTIRAARKEAASYRFMGCVIELDEFRYGVWNDNVIEENFAMLPSDAPEFLNGNERYRFYQECAVVAAMKNNLEIRRVMATAMIDQTHDTARYTVRTRCSGNVVQVNWQFKPGCRGGDYTLLGFRKEGEFGADKWSEETNGMRVIDSNRDGQIAEALEPGRNYFYTLFLKRMDRGFFAFFSKETTYSYYSALRFSLRIPTAEETRYIDRQFESLQPKKDPYWVRLEKSFEQLRAKIKGVGALKTFERNMIMETQERDDFKSLSPEEQGQWIDDIKRLCEGLKFVVED